VSSILGRRSSISTWWSSADCAKVKGSSGRSEMIQNQSKRTQNWSLFRPVRGHTAVAASAFNRKLRPAPILPPNDGVKVPHWAEFGCYRLVSPFQSNSPRLPPYSLAYPAWFVPRGPSWGTSPKTHSSLAINRSDQFRRPILPLPLLIDSATKSAISFKDSGLCSISHSVSFTECSGLR